VLELDGVEASELDRDGRGTGDPGRGVVVGDVHLLHIASRDHVALCGAPVTGDDNAAGVLQRNDGGAVRWLGTERAGLRVADARGQQLGGLTAQEVRK
jgi:hypothetical protein